MLPFAKDSCTVQTDLTADMATTTEEIGYSTENATWSPFTEPMEQVIAAVGLSLRRLPPLLSRCQNYRLFIVVAMCSVGTVGFVGNILSAFVFWLYRKRSATVLLLICLAVVDCLVVVFYVVVTYLPVIAHNRGDVEYLMYTSPYIVVYVRPIAQTLHMMTTWLTVLVAIQRYLAVCLPHHAAKYGSWRAAAFQTLFVVVFALVFNLMSFLDEEVSETPSGRLISAPTEQFNSELYKKVYVVGLYYTIIYVVPILILSKVTWSLTRALHERSKKKQVMSTGNSFQKDPLTLPLLVVIVVSMTCQLMNLIRVFWEKLENPGPGCDEPYQYFALLVPVANVSNSSLNCVIYTVFSPRFREHFLRVLRCRRLRRLLQMRVGPVRTTTTVVHVQPLPQASFQATDQDRTVTTSI